MRVAALLTSLFLAACASAPVQEMSDARQAISAAEEAGAQTHAPQDIGAARALLASAQQHLDGRRFWQARQDAREAKLKAGQALTVSQSATPNGTP